MNIVICGSMSASTEMLKVGQYLSEQGHEVVLPKNADKYASLELSAESSHESTQNKIDHDLIKGYYMLIKASDVVVIVNADKGDKRNYVGGNTFLEAGFAHVLDKKLYFLNDIGKSSYGDELRAMQPIILNRDLSKIQ
jgi:nucleoside 2-deoxyribosyltransferase